MASQRWCGIHYETHEQDHYAANIEWLPLISLSAHATICQNSSRLTLKQAFSNPTKDPIPQAAYSFPIYEGAAIIEFTCKIDSRIIRGVVRDKHTARKIYETAKEQGQQAALMIYNTPDVWSTKISNIPGLGKVEVEITVVSELKHDTQVDGIRFTLPTSIAPRYGSVPDNLPPGISAQSRGIQITCAVTTTYPITILQSPSHPIGVGMGSHTPNTSLSKEEFDVCKGYATLSQKDTALDKDFVLLIVSGGIGEPQAILETHSTISNSRALFLSLVPKFNLPRIKPEVVFIADRSGSMCSQIPQLKNALTVFLKSLPVGVKFNICSFGSTYSFLWPKSRPYDQDNLNTALKHVENFDADFGGTEMFPPIEAAFKNRFADLETEILVLTDGEIWDSEALFKLVQAECESGTVRLFSLGIGDDVSHALVEGLARAGRGYAQIVGNEDKLDVKVVQMLKAALGAHVTDYHLVFPDDSSLITDKSCQKEGRGEEEGFEFVESENASSQVGKSATEEVNNSAPDDKLSEKKETISLYDTTADTSTKISSEKDRFSHLPGFQPPTRLQTPHRIPPLYTFSRTNVYILLSGSEATPPSVTVRGTTTSGVGLELEVPIKDVGRGTTVHQLAAKRLLKELEEGGSYLHSGKFGVDPKSDEGKFVDWIEREAVRVGTTFGVAGKWTSFVAVENVADLELEIAAEDSSNGTVVAQGFGITKQLFFPSISSPPGIKNFSSMNKLYAVPCSASSHATLESARTNSFQSYGSQALLSVPTGIRRSKFMKSGGKSSCSIPMPLSMIGVEDAEEIAPEIETEIEQTRSELSSDTETDRTEIVGDVASKVYALLRMQEFDGSFPSGSGKWASTLGKTFKAWVEQKHDDEEGSATLRAIGEQELKKLLASAVAIALFQRDLKDCKDLWEMLVEKTDEWGVEKVGGETAWNALKLWVDQQVVFATELDKQGFWQGDKNSS